MGLTLVCAGAVEAADEVRRAWDRSQAVLVLNPSAPAAERGALLRRLQPDAEVAPEVAAVVATSGTTGDPRGVELTWSGLMASAQSVTEALAAELADRWLCCLPLHHVGGLSVVARSWATGVPVTVLDRFDVAAIGDAVGARSSHRPTLVSLVPTMLRRLLISGTDLAPFRRILVGGAPMTDPLPTQATPTYGLTETWGGVVHDGHALPGAEIRLRSDGEIMVRGSMVMAGYRLAPEETARVLGADGWMRTGDLGAIDNDGRLTVIDRLRDLIITGGVNVSPNEVERVLGQHPAVAEVCVAGAADPDWGQRVVAYVVAADATYPPDVATLRTFASAQLSAPKLPRQVILVDAIPRTASGKPMRRWLATPGNTNAPS